jgi:hypothetical protein
MSGAREGPGDSDDTAPADERLAPDALSLPGTPSFKTNALYDQAMSQDIWGGNPRSMRRDKKSGALPSLPLRRRCRARSGLCTRRMHLR